jgi:hypothetical protein
MARAMYPRLEHIETVCIAAGHQPLFGRSLDDLIAACLINAAVVYRDK